MKTKKVNKDTCMAKVIIGRTFENIDGEYMTFAIAVAPEAIQFSNDVQETEWFRNF